MQNTLTPEDLTKLDRPPEQGDSVELLVAKQLHAGGGGGSPFETLEPFITWVFSPNVAIVTAPPGCGASILLGPGATGNLTGEPLPDVQVMNLAGIPGSELRLALDLTGGTAAIVTYRPFFEI